jgi:hypothetical protein
LDDTLSKAGEKWREKMAEWEVKIQEKMASISDRFWTWYNGLGEGWNEWLTNWETTMTTKLNTIVNDFWSWTGEMKQKWEDFKQELKDKWTGFWDDVKQAVRDAGPNIVAELTLAWAEIKTFFDVNTLDLFLNFLATATQAGIDFVDGLKQGLISSWWKVTSWFNTKIQGLIDLFDSIFKFGSPSKVMEEKGRLIAEGLRLGMASGLSALSLQPYVQGLVGSTPTTQALATTSVGPAGSNSRPTTVQMTVNIESNDPDYIWRQFSKKLRERGITLPR